MAKHDLTGAVDFGHLERFAAFDTKVVDEVLGLFGEQAALWAPMLNAEAEGWRLVLASEAGRPEALVGPPATIPASPTLTPPQESLGTASAEGAGSGAEAVRSSP